MAQALIAFLKCQYVKRDGGESPARCGPGGVTRSIPARETRSS